MNRLYEGMFLLDANETAKRWDELEGQVGTLLNRHGGEIQYAERWPSQRLAYEVKGARKGTYYLTYFTADPTKISDMRRDAELSEDILRLLVIQEEWLESEMNRRREAAASRPPEPVPAPAPAPETAAVESAAGAETDASAGVVVASEAASEAGSEATAPSDDAPAAEDTSAETPAEEAAPADEAAEASEKPDDAEKAEASEEEEPKTDG